jgi:hypothetical protein
MERPYIWFHTGVGCAVAAVGSVISAMTAVAIAASIQWNALARFGIFLVVSAVGVLPAFLVEHRYRKRLRRRNTGESDERQH